MDLRRLSLRDYRNFERETLDLSARFTILTGRNGAGKTNALEAIYLLSTIRSFRAPDLQPLVRHGHDLARIELDVSDAEVALERRYSIELLRAGNRLRRTASIDGKTVRAAADFYGRVRTILFTPEDLAVLRGSPGARRRLLDRMLFARQREHIRDVQAYEKLVRSRNQVLREGSGSQRDDLLSTYEERLSSVGSRIWTRRQELLMALEPTFADVFSRIHGGPRSPSLSYRACLGSIPAAQREDALVAEFLRRRREDLLRGATSVGPHRDDFVVDLDGHDAGTFASQGQARALMLAFKLAELRLARDERGQVPTLLLDDVSSELDPQRTALLFEALAQDAGQCVLTTTDPAYVLLPPRAERQVLRIQGGRLERAKVAEKS